VLEEVEEAAQPCKYFPSAATIKSNNLKATSMVSWENCWGWRQVTGYVISQLATTLRET
jgi:hypothetical protein